jgi:glyoxylase-like metal-dependent hydrolase (beta-lactamase superfamily II)
MTVMTRTRLALIGAVSLAAVSAAWLASRETDALTIRQLADNLFVIAGSGGNTAVFIRAGGVILVDTKDPGTGPRLLDMVRTVTDKPITHILNTHTHFDHVGANGFFAPQVEIVAHATTATRMARMEEFADPAAKHGLPDRTFTDRLTLFSGPETIDLHYFGPAHTDGDAFVVFRGAGVMHAGDTFPGVNVVADSGGSAEEYPETMSRAAATITGVNTVIPGHGEVATWRAFVDEAARISSRR